MQDSHGALKKQFAADGVLTDKKNMQMLMDDEGMKFEINELEIEQ